MPQRLTRGGSPGVTPGGRAKGLVAFFIVIACIGCAHAQCLTTSPASLTYDVCYGSEAIATQSFDIVNSCDALGEVEIFDSVIPCRQLNGQCADPFRADIPPEGSAGVQLHVSAVLGDASVGLPLDVGTHTIGLPMFATLQNEEVFDESLEIPVIIRVHSCGTQVPEFPTVAVPAILVIGLMAMVLIVRRKR